MIKNCDTVRMSKSVSAETVNEILGFNEGIPLSLEGMVGDLKVTFFQKNPLSYSLNNFYNKLKLSFEELGVEIINFEDALNDAGKVKPNIAVFVAGMSDDYLMVNYVTSLYKNPIIGLYEGKCPAKASDSNQEKLDAVVSVLAFDVVHLAIFVDDQGWTICTMNGAIIPTTIEEDINSTVLECLVPKLTAQVVPPNVLSEISYRKGVFNPKSAEFALIIRDMAEAALSLKENGLIMSHTSVDSLKHKSKFHERIVRAYLDERSGMSYGFMSWQLPINSKPAILTAERLFESNGSQSNYIPVNFLGKEYMVDIPDVWVLVTRSGCDKTNLDISKDIVRMGLSNGKIILDLPLGAQNGQEFKPSYDTNAILAHALGNSIVSSLLKKVIGENHFSAALEHEGISLFHWHGYLSEQQLPENHYDHGINNPSVSCSTRQSAVYSLTGKIEALEKSLRKDTPFLGDVHIEPHHGSNISSTQRLTAIVEFLKQYYPGPTTASR